MPLFHILQLNNNNNNEILTRAEANEAMPHRVNILK